MKIYDKFAQKYGTNTVILPPPPEDVEDQELPVESEEGEEVSLRHGPTPEIKAPTEKEMKFWEQWLSAKNNLKGLNMGESSGSEDTTIPPPGKKASKSIDQIMKQCSKYYDLCRKF